MDGGRFRYYLIAAPVAVAAIIAGYQKMKLELLPE
jgi:hypothetical protein